MVMITLGSYHVDYQTQIQNFLQVHDLSKMDKATSVHGVFLICEFGQIGTGKWLYTRTIITYHSCT